MNEESLQARPIGRLLRLVTGLALTLEGGRHALGGTTQLMLGVALVFFLWIAFYSGLHAAISRLFNGLNAWIGAVLAVAPVAVVFLLAGAPGRLGTLLFVGISLLISAARADGGCEVMTLPSMIFGKRTHLVCIAFSPVDWIEQRAVRSSNAEQ